jgi:hypothetical protein
VIFYAVDSHRLKGSQADVQRDFRSLNAALVDAVENLRSEV